MKTYKQVWSGNRNTSSEKHTLVSKMYGCWSGAEYQQSSSDSLSQATAQGTRGGGQGLTSMFNRKSRGRRRRKKWRDLEAVVPLQAVYSGAKDSQLILFTLYSLWDFRMCIFVYCAWMCFILFKGHDYRIQYRGFYFR